MSDENTPEVLFYHLEHRPLDRVLPSLIEKTLERGWRAVVQSGSQERLESLDAVLWTYQDDSFLPHGTAREGHAAQQPVYLTTTDATPNGAGVRFLVDGAATENYAGLIRIVHLFDGNDPEMLQRAREEWRKARVAGYAVTYWKQGGDGSWQKME